VLDRARERFDVQYHAPVWFWDWAIFLYAIPPTILIVDVARRRPCRLDCGPCSRRVCPRIARASRRECTRAFYILSR
jgi:hypothetical protein